MLMLLEECISIYLALSYKMFLIHAVKKRGV